MARGRAHEERRQGRVALCRGRRRVRHGAAAPCARGRVERKTAAEWLGSFASPIGFEIRELTIAARGGVAFAHGLHHVTGKRKTGEVTDMWFRSTMGLQKNSGRWQITHEHISEPFDMQTFRALLDLKP